MKNIGRVFLRPMVRSCGIGRALHNDDRGDNQNLGTMLILALVLVPLIVIIAFFGDKIWKKAECKWDDMFVVDVGGGAAAKKGKDCP